MDLRILKIRPDSNAETKVPSLNLSLLTIAVINLHFSGISSVSKSNSSLLVISRPYSHAPQSKLMIIGNL